FDGNVESVAFTADGREIITGGTDGLVRFHDATTGRQLGAPLRHQETVRAMVVSPDGRSVLTASWDRTARLWALARSAWGLADHSGDTTAPARGPGAGRPAGSAYHLAVFSP